MCDSGKSLDSDFRRELCFVKLPRRVTSQLVNVNVQKWKKEDGLLARIESELERVLWHVFIWTWPHFKLSVTIDLNDSCSSMYLGLSQEVDNGERTLFYALGKDATRS